MRHLLMVLLWALRHPVAASWGVREFRSDLTKSYDDWRVAESYDAGREFAHMVTLRRWDNA